MPKYLLACDTMPNVQHCNVRFVQMDSVDCKIY